MAAMHTASSLDKRILQKSSFEELEYNNEHKYFTLLWNYTKTKILMCVLLLVSQYLPFECCCGALCTNMSLLILLSPNISFSCVGAEPKQQTLPFQFKQGLLTRPFFSLGGLGLCQKVCICMPNLVMLITHFGQKRKYWPSKCPSRYVLIMTT